MVILNIGKRYTEIRGGVAFFPKYFILKHFFLKTKNLGGKIRKKEKNRGDNLGVK